MKDLNEHGPGCRCLIRLWENEGRATLSDEAFINRYLERYPAWAAQPGLADDLTLFEIAKDLGLAAGITVSRDYARVTRAFLAGDAVLVRTGCSPVPTLSEKDDEEHVLLLSAIDEGGFTLWRPFRNGSSDVLPRAAPMWWEAWFAVGLILHKQFPGTVPRGDKATVVADPMIASSR
jgi:hypothetical protein